MPQFFKPEQEDAFLQWEQAHPHGFFVNSSPGRWNPKYLVAHDIGCSSVHRHKGRMLQYSKHCFESVEEFFQFFEQQGGSLLRYSCQQCKIARRFATNDFSQLQYLAKLLRTSYEVEGKQMPMPKGLLKPEKGWCRQGQSLSETLPWLHGSWIKRKDAASAAEHPIPSLRTVARCIWRCIT